MTRIDFLPVCSNCGTVLWDQTIDIVTEEVAVGCCDESVAFMHHKSIIPFQCPICKELFEQIVIPIKLPFATPEKPETCYILKKEAEN